MEGRLNGFFLRYDFGGLIFGGLIHEGVYFRNFMVLYFYLSIVTLKCNVNNEIKVAMDNLKQKFDAH